MTVGPLESDRRVRLARRTPAGDAEVAELDRLSDELAQGLLAPLSDRQRTQLLDAVATVERLLTAGMVEIAPADAAGDDVRFCVESYFAELDRRMDHGFDAARSRYGDIAEFVEQLTQPCPRRRFVVHDECSHHNRTAPVTPASS